MSRGIRERVGLCDAKVAQILDLRDLELQPTAYTLRVTTECHGLNDWELCGCGADDDPQNPDSWTVLHRVSFAEDEPKWWVAPPPQDAGECKQPSRLFTPSLPKLLEEWRLAQLRNGVDAKPTFHRPEQDFSTNACAHMDIMDFPCTSQGPTSIFPKQDASKPFSRFHAGILAHVTQTFHIPAAEQRFYRYLRFGPNMAFNSTFFDAINCSELDRDEFHHHLYGTATAMLSRWHFHGYHLELYGGVRGPRSVLAPEAPSKR